MAQTTPANVAANATIQNALSMGDLSVIGVMKAHDGRAALLRSSRGRIARVMTGQRAFGVTVAAIGDAQVTIVDRNGTTFAMQVPGS